MCLRNRSIAVGLVAAAALVAASCTSAPTKWRVGAERVSETACGSFAKVSVDKREVDVTGELIAVASSVIYLHDGKALYSVPRGRIKGSVTKFAKTWEGVVAIWTLLGGVSTLSHGFILLLSGPLWLMTGTTSGLAEWGTGRNQQTIPDRKHARFPQGLPPLFESVAESLDGKKVDSTSAAELAGGCPPGEPPAPSEQSAESQESEPSDRSRQPKESDQSEESRESKEGDQPDESRESKESEPSEASGESEETEPSKESGASEPSNQSEQSEESKESDQSEQSEESDASEQSGDSEQSDSSGGSKESGESDDGADSE